MSLRNSTAFLGVLAAALALLGPMAPAAAQVVFDTGSDGSDGVLNPETDLVIDMADHPDGIYQYERVLIPAGVTVTFLRNAQNAPVTWLVQESCVIEGTVDVSGKGTYSIAGGEGGPGGYDGGQGIASLARPASPGYGPGGGKVNVGASAGQGGAGSYAASGTSGFSHPPGDVYGNRFLLPLLGGSGGKGGGNGTGTLANQNGGGGGGGAILIAAGEEIVVNGVIRANGGSANGPGAGSGSGGGIRLVALEVRGSGSLEATGGPNFGGNGGGLGYIRIEGRFSEFSGSVSGAASGAASTSSAPGILVLPEGVLPALTIASIAGVAVPPNPTGSLAVPDVDIPLSAANPVDVVVQASNLEPGQQVTVRAIPEAGALSEGAAATEGTVEASTATVSLNLPSGIGVVFARATNAVAPAKAAEAASGTADPAGKTTAISYRQTGLAPNGERFVTRETTSYLGGGQEIVFITESGARFPLPLSPFS